MLAMESPGSLVLRRGFYLLLLLTAAALLMFGGCTKSNDSLLKKSVQHAKKTLDEINGSQIMQLQFEDLVRTGGNLVTVVTAGVEDPARLLPYTMDDPTRPWQVVLRQDEADPALIWIEGYGENLNAPLINESVRVELIRKLAGGG